MRGGGAALSSAGNHPRGLTSPPTHPAGVRRPEWPDPCVVWVGGGRRFGLARAVGGIAAAVLLGCSNPINEIKAELSASELAAFEEGERVAQPCFVCHDVTGRSNTTGPYLQGLFGRRVGGAEGFFYSPGFRASQQVWDAPLVERFLADVPGFIPGTMMVSPSVTNPSARRALVFYLRLATAPR